MPMIDVHAAEGTFADTHRLAQEVARAVMVLDRDKQLGVVKELTEIDAEAAGDPRYAEGGGGIADLSRAALGSW